MRTIHGPIDSRPAAAKRVQRRRRFGPHLEIVVEHRGLAVEQEARVREVAFEHRQQRVEELHEPQPERLERRVPLAIPMGVRNDRDDSGSRLLTASCGLHHATLGRALLARDPAVADAGFGEDQARVGGVVAELLAELADVDA